MTDTDDAYLAREARARRAIDKQLAAAGWTVQGKDEIDVNAGPGVATREFPFESSTAGSTTCFSSTVNPSG